MGINIITDNDRVKPDTINMANECAQMLRSKVSIIVATALDSSIGRNGTMPWHISADLKRFKQLTSGHPVIMGHNTWRSLPRKPLPGRRNIVISRNKELTLQDAEVAHSLQEAVLMCATADEMFIIGGAQIYNAALPLAGNIYLTAVLAHFPDADTFFPELEGDCWECVWQSDVESTTEGLKYQFLNYKRK